MERMDTARRAAFFAPFTETVATGMPEGIWTMERRASIPPKAFPEMGLEVTKLRRIMFDSVLAAQGIENGISAAEMGMLLEKVYRREWVNEETSAYAEEILARQQINHKIPGYISDWNVRIAHKTGDDDGIANDVGIVFAKQPFVVCFVSTHTVERDFEIFIRQTAWDLFKDCGGAPEE